MKYLDPKQLIFIKELIDSKKNKIEMTSRRWFRDRIDTPVPIFDIPFNLKELIEMNLLKVSKCIFFGNTYFGNDKFFKEYFELIGKNKILDAEILSQDNFFDSYLLNKAINGKLSIDELLIFIEKNNLMSENPTQLIDLLQNLEFTIEFKREKLIQWLEKYINKFKKDKLKPVKKLDIKTLIRYREQKKIYIENLKLIIEKRPPNKLVIDSCTMCTDAVSNFLNLDEHRNYNFVELTYSLEKEKIIQITECFNLSPNIEFLIKVNEKKLNAVYSKTIQNHKKVKNDVMPKKRKIISNDSKKVIVPKKQNFFILPNNTKWSDVCIKWLNGHDVKITLKNNKNFNEIKNYKELGFYDKSAKAPDMQWKMLINAANYNNEMSWADLGGSDISKEYKNIDAFQKRVSKLRKTLINTFDIEKNPIEAFSKEKKYRININLIPENNHSDKPKKNYMDLASSEAEKHKWEELEKSEYINNINKKQ